MSRQAADRSEACCPVPTQEDRAGGALADVQLECVHGDRSQGLGRALAALAGEAQHPVADLVAEVLHVPGQRLGDAQAVVDEQAHQRHRAGPIDFGSAEQTAQLVPVQTHGGRVVVDPGTTYPGSS